MAPPWMDMDELVEEVLLRLPPDEPASLVSAGLVCKRWCYLVSDPRFRRRFRQFHRSPPMLGFFYSYEDGYRDLTRFIKTSVSFPRVLPTSVSTPRRPEYYGIQVKDSRHGRVLLEAHHRRFIVRDPIANEQIELPRNPISTDSLTAAVLCAAAVPHGSCDCDDHTATNCHRAPFVVVAVGADAKYQMMIFLCVYSSEAGAWSEVTSVPLPHCIVDTIGRARSALVGSALYFMFDGGSAILEYDLGTRAMSVIALPRAQTTLQFTLFGPTELMTMEDGRIGFARVEKSKLCLWSREVEDGAGWALSKAIDLEKALPIVPGRWTTRPWLVGSAEGVGTVFLTLNDHLFMVDLRSGRATKVVGYSRKSNTIVVPYMNFFTPVLMKARSIDDRTRASAST